MGGLGIRLEAGRVLDERFLLEKVIGQGGMGTVFAARHLELDERVAVKVLQSDSAFVTLEAEHLERFLREARLASRIKNEHVVRIIDVARGKGESPPYIVMELLDGCDLGELLEARRGPLPLPEAIHYILQACEAVAEAHALGIVHRDLKSSNLHLSQASDGSPLVKVLDFGICKVKGDASNPGLTATASVFGSPAYMSPEQIRSSKNVDPRTDVWAIACVLYELLTAELPFPGTNPADMLSNIANMPHIPLRKFVPTMPDGMELALRAAFVKDRELRTPSIAAFAAAIAPFGDATSAASLATIQRIAARPRGEDGALVRASPIAMPAAMALGATQRAGSADLPAEPVVHRTDRALVVAAPAPTAGLPRWAGLGIALATALVIVLVLVVKNGSRVPPIPERAPAVEIPVVMPVATPSPPPPASSDVVEIESPPSPATSARVVVRPKLRPHSPAPKPHGTIDTNLRE